MDGTSLFQFKTAYIAALTARTPNVSYASPSTATDVMGDDGSGAAVWWEDTSHASIDQVVFTGSTVHPFDESYALQLVIQVLGRDTSATQDQCDATAVEILGEAIAVLSTDPTAGYLDSTETDLHAAHPTGWSYTSGQLTPDTRAAKFILDITVEARITLEST
jgi:hypothetical protein